MQMCVGLLNNKRFYTLLLEGTYMLITDVYGIFSIYRFQLSCNLIIAKLNFAKGEGVLILPEDSLNISDFQVKGILWSWISRMYSNRK